MKVVLKYINCLAVVICRYFLTLTHQGNFYKLFFFFFHKENWHKKPAVNFTIHLNKHLPGKSLCELYLALFSAFFVLVNCKISEEGHGPKI